MLIGQFKSKLTDKDRLAVPKKFRSDLGNNLIIARWYENCLVLVSHRGWSKLQRRLQGKSDLIISPRRDIERFIMALAFEINLDDQGRFVLPEILKQFSGIKNEVVFVGLYDRVEIWDKDRWDKLEEQIGKKANQAIDEIAKLDLG